MAGDGPRMTAAATEADRYRTQFEELDSAGPGWLRAMRGEAMARFSERGWPTTRDEAWRHTSVAALARAAFTRPDGDRTGLVAPERLKQLDFGSAFTGWEIVFVDGRYAPELSSAVSTEGVRISSLQQALREEPERLRPRLGRLAGLDEADPFRALNTAFLEDGGLVEVAPGATPSAPIHLIFFSTGQAARPTVSHPRTLILAAPGSQATVVETYAGAEGGSYFTNAVTEVALEEGAVVDHYKLQRDSDKAFHVATLAVGQGRGSVFTDHSVCVGGTLARNHVEVRFEGEGGECELQGLFVADGAQHMDTHSLIDHAAPRCSSRELYKGILDGRARGVFYGNIIVHPGAQKTNATQTNKNLLLSKEALVDSIPGLQIYANDVKCKHGSTTGQIDEDAVFYLRSRGIDAETARAILTYAFAREVVDLVRVPAMRATLGVLLLSRLPNSEAVREAL